MSAQIQSTDSIFNNRAITREADADSELHLLQRPPVIRRVNHEANERKLLLVSDSVSQDGQLEADYRQNRRERRSVRKLLKQARRDHTTALESAAAVTKNRRLPITLSPRTVAFVDLTIGLAEFVFGCSGFQSLGHTPQDTVMLSLGTAVSLVTSGTLIGQWVHNKDKAIAKVGLGIMGAGVFSIAWIRALYAYRMLNPEAIHSFDGTTTLFYFGLSLSMFFTTVLLSYSINPWDGQLRAAQLRVDELTATITKLDKDAEKLLVDGSQLSKQLRIGQHRINEQHRQLVEGYRAQVLRKLQRPEKSCQDDQLAVCTNCDTDNTDISLFEWGTGRSSTPAPLTLITTGGNHREKSSTQRHAGRRVSSRTLGKLLAHFVQHRRTTSHHYYESRNRQYDRPYRFSSPADRPEPEGG